MKRIGQAGQPTYVYKLRTMHPYAEYLQAYIYEQHDLQENGKFNDDFRITTWGRVLRKTWLDELPMLLNWLKRDMKLVGVRPLSEHYLGLYPKELAELRLRYKPGLLPPFYADMPQGFDEILKSEEEYLKAYALHPIRTDVQYAIRILTNIFVKRVRSQ
jgi:lipopolysaccharide/colanic/teichoic acid biosynthesis glycosyltransferase